MNTIKAGLILAVFWLASSLVMAGDNLSTAEMKQLLTGNTAEEKNVKWGWERKLYFKPDGILYFLDQNGNKTDANWSFEREGVLCIFSGKERCWKLVPSGDENTYNVHGRKSGNLKKIWKIVQGNPFKL